MGLGLGGVVVKEPFSGNIVQAKTDDHAMHRRLAPRLAAPLEGAVGEVDFQAMLEQVGSEDAYLFALGDGVGGDKGGADAVIPAQAGIQRG